MNNYTFTTLLGSDDYFLPVYMLHYSLQQVKSKYPLTVIVMDTVKVETIEALEKNNISYKIFPNVQRLGAIVGISQENPKIITTNIEYFQLMVMNKFYAFDLQEFDKVCFLDADIIVRKNIDFVFKYNAPAAKILEYGRIQKRNNQFTVDDPFIAGEYWVIDPKTYSSEQIFKDWTILAFDESVLSHLYPISRFANITFLEDSFYIFHAHAHCDMFRYWNFFSLNSTDDIEVFYSTVDYGKLEKLKMLGNNNKDEFFKDFHNIKVLDASLIGEQNVENIRKIQEGNQIKYNLFLQKLRTLENEE